MRVLLTKVPTFTATIWVGFKNRATGDIHFLEKAEAVCAEFCDEVGLCVSVTPTKFIYVDGDEPGCAVGIINYPRFPEEAESLQHKALALAARLLVALDQLKVSVVFKDETIMLGEDPVPVDRTVRHPEGVQNLQHNDGPDASNGAI